MFIGRGRELGVLEGAYSAADSAFVPIYGRRRVGKTELIRRFVDDKRAIFHVGKVSPPGPQQREFLVQAARLLDEPLIGQLPADDWSRALDALDRYEGAGKLVLVFDEFQWTAQASPELPSLLQERWDHGWRDSGRMFLILCGSYIGFMEREVLGKESPLFGRRTAQLRLEPFRHDEAALFHPRWSREDQARAYFLCGGVPAYLRRLDDSRSLEVNIRQQILEPSAAMHREPEFLLREELREVERYFAVLMAVATGGSTMKEVSARTDIDERALYYYVQQLVELGYVERRHPLSERRKKSPRKFRLSLCDPLLRFWFRFVFPDQSYLAEVGPDDYFRDVVRSELPSYFGTCFESLCRGALPQLYRREGVATAYEVGSYWDKQVQIDVVGVRDDDWTDIGECKWGTVRSGKRLAEEIRAKARAFPNPRNATLGLRAFTRRKPRGATEDVIWHELDDLY